MGQSKNCHNLFAATTSHHLLQDIYQKHINHKKLLPDTEQKQLVQALQDTFNQFITKNKKHCSAAYQTKLLALFGYQVRSNPCEPLTGLYIWGDVGRGKTYLMNLFYQHLPTQRKRRLHFHRFMQWIYEQLEQLANTADPLQIIAKQMAEETCILCLDEMHITDITDAMLLYKLLSQLFDAGVVLITTSNNPPNHLYKNGLQRERFLPAIALLKQHNTVIEVGGTLDYRLQTLQKNTIYYLLSDPTAEQQLATHYQQLSGLTLHEQQAGIIINKRVLAVKKWADSVVWFDFDMLCNTPRSTKDYIQIGKIFQTVLISAIPIMDYSSDDSARRFINMVDVFYDLQVNLIVSAETEPERLYQGTQLRIEFKRTISRLHEMQSKDYLMRKHTQII